MRAVVKWALSLPTVLFRWGDGRLLGHRFLLLTHRGRKSGRTFRTVVEVMRWDAFRREAFVMAGWGRRTQWFLNLEAGGALAIQIGGERWVAPGVRVLPMDEAAEVLADYERRNALLAPLVRAVLSRLVGFRYDGSPAARRRVAQLQPIVALRPG